jgi:phospholipid/cholesterol/gamma-HCH transport system ATP-binding protein
MGASGGGKTTVLRLISGQYRAQSGQLVVRWSRCVVPARAQPALYLARRRMGMLFQFGALFTDLSVFDNVAFPLREHTELGEELIRDVVLMKLQAVGLRGARDLMPSEVSGGMARRVALARAMALDPELIMYDEPFAGLDPISLGTAARLIRQLNDSLGLTSIIVSHDLEETFRIADQVIILANGRIAAQGTPDQVRQSTDPLVHQFVTAAPDGPVRFHHPGPDVASDFGTSTQRQTRGARMSWYRAADWGWWTRRKFADLGHAARLMVRLVGMLGVSLRRWRLVVDQVHFLGNHSLAIIAVSGLFVGFVLGLQGYYTLQRYGSSSALGLLVALSLVRELGPSGQRLAVCWARRHLAHRRNRFDEGGRATERHGLDGRRPHSTHSGPALLGRRFGHAGVGGGVQCRGHHGRVGGRCGDDWRRFRLFLGPNAVGRRCVERCGQWGVEKSGLWHHGDFCRPVPRARGPAHA